MDKTTKRKLIATIIALVIIVILAFVCLNVARNLQKDKPSKTEDKTEEKTKTKEKDEYSYMPVTYKVCDEDSCLHVVGSMHLGDKRIDKVDKKLVDIFNDSDYLALEIKDDEDIDPTIFLSKDGTTLDQKVSPEFYAKLEQFSKEHPMYVLEAYKNYSLGFNANVIDLLPFIEKKQTHSGIDDYFKKLATKKNKEILAFETAEFQIQLLVGYSDQLYMDMIEYSIDNYDEMVELQQELLEAYLSGDEEKLIELLEEDAEDSTATPEAQEYYDAMLTNRNNNMTEMIKGFLEDNKNVFVVVGAAHVVPEGGIIDQLTKTNNYTISRVK